MVTAAPEASVVGSSYPLVVIIQLVGRRIAAVVSDEVSRATVLHWTGPTLDVWDLTGIVGFLGGLPYPIASCWEYTDWIPPDWQRESYH